ncbi:MAG TPA: hypothetical protein PK587_02395 [Syntrophales bacterium]|nr:hypothetical protein [Syntrophales bacterium]
MVDDAFIKEYQKRFEQKLREHEISVIEHWKERLDKVIQMRPEGIASLQLELKKVSDMMTNRIQALKKG